MAYFMLTKTAIQTYMQFGMPFAFSKMYTAKSH